MLARAEAHAQAHEFEEALELFADATTAVAATGSPELAARRLLGEGWALMEQGQIREGLEVLTQAREVVDENEPRRRRCAPRPCSSSGLRASSSAALTLPSRF